MNPCEIIKDHQERSEWLGAILDKFSHFNQNLRNNFSVLELLLSKFNRSHPSSFDELKTTLMTLAESKLLIDNELALYTDNNRYKAGSFHFLEACTQISLDLEQLLKSYNISLNISMIDESIPMLKGDLSYFKLALGNLICYTVSRFSADDEVRRFLDIHAKGDGGGFLKIHIIVNGSVEFDQAEFKKSLLADQSLCKSQYIFNEYGAGFVGLEKGCGFEAVWPHI